MPLPFILGAVAAVAGVTGGGAGIHGAAKMIDANDSIKQAKERHEKNISRFEAEEKNTNSVMDRLGCKELNIINSFKAFADTIEKIHNRPEFEEIARDNIRLPKPDMQKLRDVSVGAEILLGGIGGAAAGTAGGIAAAGATTAAVMALGTASTGTAIASLSGAAATNAALAALGGGAIAAGGGGMALGSTVLGASTLGIGLLVGGIIFNVTGSKLSDQADEAYRQMKKAEENINKIIGYFHKLQKTASSYIDTLEKVKYEYYENFNMVSYTVNRLGKTDWNSFTVKEKKQTENAVLLMGLLYKMCSINFVLKAENEEDINSINEKEIMEVQNEAEILMDKGILLL